jgi:hypothetical protein
LNRHREPPTHKRKSQRIKSALAMPAIFLALAPGSDQNGKNRKTGKNADKKRATMPANAF